MKQNYVPFGLYLLLCFCCLYYRPRRKICQHFFVIFLNIFIYYCFVLIVYNYFEYLDIYIDFFSYISYIF